MYILNTYVLYVHVCLVCMICLVTMVCLVCIAGIDGMYSMVWYVCTMVRCKACALKSEEKQSNAK
ncbi:hypothetical protein EON63_25200 [archaeon]|nr:MAG: hypothetical protein EON63_25200 [archaeon]